MPVAYVLAKDYSWTSVQIFHALLALLKKHVITARQFAIFLQTVFSGDWLARKAVAFVKGAGSLYPYDEAFSLEVTENEGTRVLAMTAISKEKDSDIFRAFIDQDMQEYSKDLPVGTHLVWNNSCVFSWVFPVLTLFGSTVVFAKEFPTVDAAQKKRSQETGSLGIITLPRPLRRVG